MPPRMSRPLAALLHEPAAQGAGRQLIWAELQHEVEKEEKERTAKAVIAGMPPGAHAAATWEMVQAVVWPLPSR